jgi:hypothetical protein
MPFVAGHGKLGGRRKGTPNRKQQLKIDALNAAFERVGLTAERLQGITPLQGMMVCLHMAIEAKDRPGILAASAAAAPYVHPRLSSSEVRVKTTPTAQMSDDELLRRAELMTQQLQRAGKLPPPTIESRAVKSALVDQGAIVRSMSEVSASVVDSPEQSPNVVDIRPAPTLPPHGIDFDALDRIRAEFSGKGNGSSNSEDDVDIWTKF